MCGLVALISTNKHGMTADDIKVFEQMLYADALRGFHSVGVMAVNKYGSVSVAKSASTVTSFLTTKQWEAIAKESIKQGNILVGHNRHATKGQITDMNAHPFTAGDITLVHNGTLYNHKKIHDCEVDSEAIAHGFSKNGYEKTLKEVDGAFALIWYNIKEKRIYFSRNSKRPLYMARCKKFKDTFYIASERDMLEWILNRNNIDYGKEIVYFAPEDKDDKGTVYYFDLQSNDLMKEDVDFFRPAPITTTTTYYSGTGASTNKGYFPHNYNAYSEATKSVVDNSKSSFLIDEQTPLYKLDDPKYWDDGSKKRIIFKAEDLKTNSHMFQVDGFHRSIPVSCYSLDEDQIMDCFEFDNMVIADVSGVPTFVNGRIARIFVENPQPYFWRVSKNNVSIGAKKWIEMREKDGGVYCDDCGLEVSYKDIDRTNIFTDVGGKVRRVVCQDCNSTYGVAHVH